ncbi:nucleoside-diphosphate-sugar epimerase [Natranaerovirga hydrolytica]|uniref:Nucleoside-diphosphate-sugar epimerase n=1 Tax=Natranaerovirga hydrolytica TaxID=680378 RepID=A0A4R1MJD8_9FIRM|nr:NAD(P)-dependent oxidoreductase [Natranaerovirga hydrolytica]TCK92597.1 nucleoside-diphosphate-sugar epimerase [Natranaerovirga hydrolytica]
MKRVVVTGGTGKTGRWVVKEFLAQGYEVVNVDINVTPDDIGIPVKVDLTDLGQVFNALTGADAVVHIAAIPRPRGYTSQVVFQNNIISTYNILEASAGLGIKKVVIASSESVYGLAYAGPHYVPMDEEHPLSPIDSYALSKILNEKTAEMFNRKTGMQIVSLRIGNVMEPEDYNRFPSFINEPQKRKNIVWSYVDARDVASACRLGIEQEGLGAVVLNIAADDTSMAIKSKELMEVSYPDVTDFREPIEEYHTLLSNKKAKSLLDWQPVHFWRDYVKV